LERSLIQWFPEAKTEIAKICVTYLSFRVFESGFRNSPENFRKRLRLNRFYNYVAHNWGYHVREAPKSIEEVRSLLASNPKVESASQALNTAETLIISGRNGSQYVPRQVTALHLTAYFGLVEATSTLLEQGHEFDCPDTHGQTPLWWASGNGHVGVVELLLGKGAHLESTDYKSEQSPLSRAARKGHEGVVKLLLDKSADTNTKDKDGKTPLMWAAINGHEGIMNLFLGQNTDLESRDKWGLTPLCWAAISGNDRSVKSLRESGADLNAKDINNTTVLHWAAWEDHKGVVSLLLERNVDIETRNCGGGTALAAAIEKKSAAIVELLLAKGARVNYFYSLYRCNYSPIPRGEEYVVLSGYKWGNPGLFESGKCFYEAGHGDDLDMNNDSTAWFPDRAVTPLWRAAEKWDSATVRLLQSKGGQLDHIEPEISAYVVRRVWSPFPRFDFRTRLCWAANNGYGMIVSLLLENDKAAVELESLSCPVIPLSPPGSHVISSREDHSRWQLSEFNNWSRARQEYQTQFLSLENEREYRLTVTPRKSAMTIPKAEVFAAVALAAQNGHKNVWEILLREKRGVVNWKDFSGQTLLSYAVQYGQKDLVEVLLNFTEDKIDVNSSDNKGRTPLSYAVENKHGADILQLLIFHQADVNLADNEGRSPLLYAAGQGNVQNVRLLFQNGAVQDTIDKSGQTLVLRVIEG
jgi:ankyrin repeat protein